MSLAVIHAAHELRDAQRAYMVDRGNEALGRRVGEAAAALDTALGSVEYESAAIEVLNRRVRGLIEANNREVERRRFAERERDGVIAAGRALYMAGVWYLPTGGLSEAGQGALWLAFREAMNLAPGTATAAGVGAEATNLCAYCSDKPDCDCEPPLPFDAGSSEGLVA